MYYITTIIISILLFVSSACAAPISNKSLGGLIDVLQGGAADRIMKGDGVGNAPVWGFISFDELNSGTNSSANMIMGSGSALSFAGTGTIDASHYKGNNTVTSVEFGYVSGATSNLQAQISAISAGLGSASSRDAEDVMTDGANLPDGAAIKAYGDANWGGSVPAFSDLTSGTNSAANMIVGAGATLSFAGGTIDASHYKGNAVPTATEFSRLSGATANIQAQINAITGGLGTASSRDAEDSLTNGSNLPDGAAIIAYGDANWASAGMVYPGVGIALSTGAAWDTSITNNSASWNSTASTVSAGSSNWDTAYTDRLKWDGGSSGLNALAGRSSLGLSSTDSPSFASIALTTPLAVANGGIGTNTLTNGGVLLGSGTGAITAMSVLPNGYILIGDGTTDPTVTDAFSSSAGTLKGVYGGLGISTAGWSNHIPVITSGTATYLTNNSTNWNTAYTDRYKWDGGSSGLVPLTARNSIGMGTADVPTFAGINTGEGATEVFAMNQDVQTTNSPTFAGMTLTGQLSITGASRVRVKRLAAQSIPNNTWTTVQYNSEDCDNLGEFASYKFTATTAGYYYIHGQVLFDSATWAAGQYCYGSIYVNGVNTSSGSIHYNGTYSAFLYRFVECSDVLYLAASDYVEFKVLQVSGASKSTSADGTFSFIDVHRVS